MNPNHGVLQQYDEFMIIMINIVIHDLIYKNLAIFSSHVLFLLCDDLLACGAFITAPLNLYITSYSPNNIILFICIYTFHQEMKQ